jgi:glycosyltransferase involved in cell wall biosynthesis
LDQNIISSYINEADLVLSTTVTNLEGISNVLVQALRLGKPVIATNSGYTSCLLEDGQTGVVLPLNVSCDNFAATIASTINDEAFLGKLGENGKEASKKYTIENVTDIWEGLLE